MLKSEQVLINLIHLGESFLLTGPAGCGKTHYLESIFRKQEVKFITLNCTLADKRQNFLKLLNHQISVYLKFAQSDKLSSHSSLQAWITQMNELVEQEQYKNALNKVYFLMDCVQQLRISTEFLLNFQNSCKAALKFKLRLAFCGIQLAMKQYYDAQPFKKMMTFCMLKPQKAIVIDVIQPIVEETFISQKLFNKFIQNPDKKSQLKQEQNRRHYDKSVKYVTELLTAAYQTTESNLNKIKRMAKITSKRLATLILAESQKDDNKKTKRQNIFQQEEEADYNSRRRRQQPNPTIYNYTLRLCHHKDTAASIIKIVTQNEQLPDYTIEMMTLEQSKKDRKQAKLEKKKNMNEQTKQSDGINALTCYYPSLIMAAIYYADIYSETDDKKRFTEHRNIGDKRQTDYRKHLSTTGTKHNLQRIIAITQALQDARENVDSYPAQTLYQHHSLDYYTCFQFLQQMGSIKSYGRSYTWGKGKYLGRPDPSKVRDFMRNAGIETIQYEL